MTKITNRIERELGAPGLAKALGKELDPSDLQSLLVEVYRDVAHRRNPMALLANYRTNRFTKASNVDPAIILEWDRVALSNLPRGFQALELSPMAPKPRRPLQESFGARRKRNQLRMQCWWRDSGPAHSRASLRFGTAEELLHRATN